MSVIMLYSSGAIAADRIQYSATDASSVSNDNDNSLSWTFSEKVSRMSGALTAEDPLNGDEMSGDNGSGSSGGGSSGGGSTLPPSWGGY